MTEAQPDSQQDQVALFQLLFGMSWEDPACDVRALAIQPGDTLMTVGSGGCNTFTLLLEDPGQVFAVDINPTQGYLIELKIAAIRRLGAEELRAFLGVLPARSGERQRTFNRISSELTREARVYWTARTDAIAKGIVYSGRYESFLAKFSALLRLVQGKRRIENFFRCETLDEQRDYFDRTWNTPQWRLLFRLAFNKRVLAKRGLATNYFQFDDGSTSFSESFFRRTRHAMRELPLASNYFLAQYLRGAYWSERAVPAYLLQENLPVVRDRLDRIRIVTQDAQSWFAQLPDASINCFALSNICELMSPEETTRLFTEVARVARRNAHVCFRNLIVPRGVPASLASQIVLDEALSRDLLATDRSFVYSRCQAFLVNPASEVE